MFSGFAEDLQRMSGLHFTFFLVALSALLAYLFYLIWRNLHRARIVEDTPTAKVRSAPQGYVELEGSAKPLPGQETVAPLTRSPCVWYRFKVQVKRSSGNSGSSWDTVESGTCEDHFLFYDETGECLVNPDDAEVTPGIRKVWYGSTRWPGETKKGGLLGVLASGRYRYTEERIVNGPLYLLGWFDTLRSTDSPVAEDRAALLREWKRNQLELKQRFDKNGDGVLDESEWQEARQAAHRQVLRERADRSAEPDVHCIRAAGHDRYPYLISAKPQFALTGRYRRRAIFSLAGSVAATAFLAWMLVVRF